MSYFAKVENGIVTEVIVADQAFVATMPGVWIETSYNTRGNIHYGPDGYPDGGTPLRKNYAGIGYTYDSVLDAFYAPKPSALYELNTATGLWEVKTQYRPLAVVHMHSLATALPTATAGAVCVIDTVHISDQMTVLFTNLAAPEISGVYEYVQASGTFAYQNKNIFTIGVASDATVVYKFNGTAWVPSTVT